MLINDHEALTIWKNRERELERRLELQRWKNERKSRSRRARLISSLLAFSSFLNHK